MIVCRASSALIPAFSNSVPITESLPIIKLMKSSIISARTTITAMIANVFKFAKPNAFASLLIIPTSPPTAFIMFKIFAALITAMKAPAAIAAIFSTFPIPPNLSTKPFAISMPFAIPLDNVWPILSIAGCNRLTRAWNRSNDLVRTPFSPVSSCMAAVAFCTKAFNIFNTCTAGLRNAFPAAAFRSITDCFRFPN